MTAGNENMNKYDRRRKYYLILDCETATLPIAMEYTEEQRKNIAIAKPLIYDLGWKVIDRSGNVYATKNFLISEIFSVPAIFDTAYYANKRPLYLEMLDKGEIMLTDWKTAIRELVEDMEACEGVGAYNAMFDFKKAIPFTELYINQLYSPDFHKWMDLQNSRASYIATQKYKGKESENQFDPDVFRFRGKEYRLFDVWGLACRHILNCDDYKQMCIDNSWITASGKYFKTSAETAFRFFAEKLDFDEAHTAVADCAIESELFAEIVRKSKNKWEYGIVYFPFRELGKIEDWMG